MNTKRFILAGLATFLFVFVLEFIIHGLLLRGMYDQTAHLWRPQEESNMFFLFLGQFLFAAIATFIFTRNFEGKGLGEGSRFGLYLGALLVSLEVGKFCYLPIPVALWVSWMVSSFLKGWGSGLVLALVYQK